MMWPSSFCWSTFQFQGLLLFQRWRWGFDADLLPLPSLACLLQPPPESHIADHRYSHSSPNHTSPLRVKTTHERGALLSPWAHARGIWERSFYLCPPQMVPHLVPHGMMASTEVTTIQSCHGNPFLFTFCERCPSFSNNNLSCWLLSGWSQIHTLWTIHLQLDCEEWVSLPV